LIIDRPIHKKGFCKTLRLEVINYDQIVYTHPATFKRSETESKYITGFLTTSHVNNLEDKISRMLHA